MVLSATRLDAAQESRAGRPSGGRGIAFGRLAKGVRPRKRSTQPTHRARLLLDHASHFPLPLAD